MNVIRSKIRERKSERFPNDRKSSQKHSSQRGCCNRWTRYRVRRNKSRFAFGHSLNCFVSCAGGWIDAASARISPPCVGDGSFLCTQDAGDFTRAPRNADHVRAVSFFAESTLSRWKRVHLLRSGAAVRVANGAFWLLRFTFPSWISLSVGKKGNWNKFSVERGRTTRSECADGSKPISNCWAAMMADQDVPHLGVVRPPLVYLASIVLAALIQLAVPLPFLPRTLAVPVGPLSWLSPLLCSLQRSPNSGPAARQSRPASQPQ